MVSTIVTGFYVGILKYSTERGEISPYLAKVIYLNFQPLGFMSRYRDPQPEVVKLLIIYLIYLRPKINKY